MAVSLLTLLMANEYTKAYVDEHGGGGGDGGTPDSYVMVPLSADWTGSASPYTQIVTIGDYTITDKSKVDLLATTEVVAQMQADGTERIYIQNDGGTLTAYAVGGKPSAAMSVPSTISEVK